MEKQCTYSSLGERQYVAFLELTIIQIMLLNCVIGEMYN